MTTTIRELLDDIQSMDLVLPEFQREYVWTKEQAKQLMVSLYRDYPTGSLLFWTTDTPPEIKNADGLPDKLGSARVILDGQQRLTTLHLLVRGEIPRYYNEDEIKNDPRNLYFNLDDGDFQYYQSQRMDPNPTWVSVVQCFKSGDEGISPTEIARRKSGDPAEQMRLTDHYFEHLKKLQAIRDRNYSIQVVPRSANIDDAIDVFDRVNSLGTKLTDAELALTHITGKWPHARRVLKAKIAELERKDFSFDLTFMVRAFVGITHGRGLFEKIHKTPRDVLEPSWNTLEKLLDYLVNVLPGRASIHSTDDLNTTNVLVPVLVYLGRNGMKFDNDDELFRCIRWLYAASMWARYSSQTDNRIDHDLSVIQRTANPWDELTDAIIDQRGRIEVKASDFEGRAIQHPLYRTSYVIIKANDAVDWFNGSPLKAPHGKAYQIHSHHIFPSSQLYKNGGFNSENHLHKKVVNEIANRAFLTASSNVDLSDELPENYLPKVVEKYPGALEKQFVPTNPALWKLDNYEDFLMERRRLLAEAINLKMDELLIPQGEEAPPPSASELVDFGENAAVEFKSTLRWDVYQKKVNRELEKVVAKSVSGFLNAHGGTLLIGIDDDGAAVGLANDLNSLKRKDLDGFEQAVITALENYLGADKLHGVSIRFDTHEGEDVCIVEVERSSKPVYLKAANEREFYVRIGNTTRPLHMQEAHDYIQSQWEA